MRTINWLVMTLVLVMLAGVAQADVVTFGDSVTHWPGWGGYQDQDSKDVIGIPDITGGSATFDTSNPSLFSLNSVSFNLNPGGDQSTYESLSSGDLFLNTGEDTTWDYVVRLNNDGTADVYAAALEYNSSTGYILASVSGGRVNHPAWADVSGLTAVATASWTGLPDWNGGSVGTVSIDGLDVDFTTLSLAYTVSCANDVIFECSVAQTPIPGAALLLGSGLLGLLGLRRRLFR